MAVVHNVILRGYNSIYKQALHIHERDIGDFVGYCLAWVEMVLGHHRSEEAVLFPMLAEGAGVPGLMDADKNEHGKVSLLLISSLKLNKYVTDAFYSGLGEFKDYLESCTVAADPPAVFNGAHAVALLDSFGPALHSHLANEAAHLASLSKYPNIDLEPIQKATEKDAMDRTSAVFLLPMLWFNHDVDFEDGYWSGFPGLPAPMKWVMVNVFGWWRSNWWRFGSVDRNGKLIELLALREGY